MFSISLDDLLRIVTVLIFFFWWLYWRITEQEAKREKPQAEQEQSFFQRSVLMKLFLGIAQAILILQLLGLQLFPISASAGVLFSLQVIGFLFVVLGVCIAVSARKTLGTNWSHAADYQVKHKQELVTTGVYAFIRHPIYTGLVLAFIGGELLVKSFVLFLCLLLIVGAYRQALLEEKLLLTHFGEAYKIYMKRTKKFLPFLW